jgi:hypothetical protein
MPKLVDIVKALMQILGTSVAGTYILVNFQVQVGDGNHQGNTTLSQTTPLTEKQPVSSKPKNDIVFVNYNKP